MLSYLPFLISANSLGVIFFLVFVASSIILNIPTFASRGGTQIAWFGVAGFLLTIELAVMIALVVLVANGDIWQ
ncbi:MAG: hypothetical protein IT304_00745 [Dehalococcoidia bacterium]|nr:hypothetical protein [Dehalococcoidia bacterium]